MRDENEGGVPKFLTYPHMPETIWINPEERRGCSSIFWKLYKLLRAMHISWFYFLPSCFLFGLYLAPLFMIK
jgi:hypothetical protein